MTNICNIFVVRTPLQLLNAIEVKNQRHIADMNYLVIVYGNLIDQMKLSSVLKLDHVWHKIIWVKFFGIEKKLYAWRFLLGKYILPNVANNIYIGMITHIPLHLANIISHEQLYLLDDGNETYLLSQNIEKRNFKEKKYSWLFKIKQDTGVLENIKYFTIYDLPFVSNNRQIKNNYSFFKSIINNLVVRNDSYLFIGSNLIGNYLSSEENYLKFLQWFKNKFNDKAIYYAPHRYEKQGQIEKIKNIGYIILTYESILEIAQQQQGWKFSANFSIRSTALDTLKLLYNIEPTVCCLPSSYFVSNSKYQECDFIWKQYKNRLVFTNE